MLGFLGTALDEEEMGTLKEYLAECGFILEGAHIITQKEIVGFEKFNVTMS
jgi:hypothetical protein